MTDSELASIVSDVTKKIGDELDEAFNRYPPQAAQPEPKQPADKK